MTALNIFTYSGQQVRTVVIDDAIWFVAGDVTDLLGYANGRTAIAVIPDRMKGSVQMMDGTPGNPNRAILNEAGVNRLIMRSTLPQAERIQDWIAEDVLPSIRKTGSYSNTPAPAELSRLQILELAMESEHRAIAEGARADQAEAQVAVLHNSKGLPVRNFVRKYFPDAKETDVFNMLYGKHLLICDPRGRWSDKQKKRIPGATHMHPYVAGKRFFELAEEEGNDGRMHLKTRVRRDAELALIGWLESQGFTSGVAHDSFALAVNS